MSKIIKRFMRGLLKWLLGKSHFCITVREAELCKDFEKKSTIFNVSLVTVAHDPASTCQVLTGSSGAWPREVSQASHNARVCAAPLGSNCDWNLTPALRPHSLRSLA